MSIFSEFESIQLHCQVNDVFRKYITFKLIFLKTILLLSADYMFSSLVLLNTSVEVRLNKRMLLEDYFRFYEEVNKKRRVKITLLFCGR